MAKGLRKGKTQKSLMSPSDITDVIRRCRIVSDYSVKVAQMLAKATQYSAVPQASKAK